MSKLQLRVDRTEAELIARALRYLGFHWNDATKPHHALELAERIDHRVIAYFGIDGAVDANSDKVGTRRWLDGMRDHARKAVQ